MPAAKVGEDGQDVQTVATSLGVGWATVMRAVRDYGTPLVDDPARLAGVVAVGVDETAFLAAGPCSSTQFVTGIVAMPGPGRSCAQLLDIVPGRTRAALQQWFSGCDPAWRDAITTASLDPYRGYATALTHSLPQAVRVLDAFHVVRLGQACVDEVRRRVQQQTLGRRGHREDPLYRARRDLRRGLAHITDRQWARLELALVVGDPSGHLTDTWMAAQELQLLTRPQPRSGRRQAPAVADPGPLRTLAGPRAAPPRPHLGHLVRGALGLLDGDRSTWCEQRPDRGHQRPDQKVKRVGHGFRNLENYRLRLLLTVGLDWNTVHWQAPPATPIRGRSPRLVA